MRIRLTVALLFALCALPIKAMASEPSSSGLPIATTTEGTLCLSGRQGDCTAREAGTNGPDGATKSTHCSLYQASFSRCLSSAAVAVVRRDPGAPAAVAAFKITVKDDVTGTTMDTTVLTATAADIADVVGVLHYSLQVAVTDNGSTRVAFHLTGDGVMCGIRDFAIGDSQAVAMEHAMVTIARL